MKRWHLFLTLSAEEDWLNGIQMQGYRLVRVQPVWHRYTFEALPADATFSPVTRLDCREAILSKRHYQDYCQLFSDSGWTLIHGNRYGGIQYFQQSRVTATDEIFSDQTSKALSQSHDSNLGIVYGVVFLVWFLGLNLESKWLNNLNVFDFRSWYFRPGLWQMPSSQFWPAFWFETPFALFRGLMPFVLLLISGYYFARVFSTMRTTPLK
ncbi:DUF2812 domain-containing protein [Lactiplantibacillus daowaiensis]|uniref:DUF2812 domain-containing protein n=1 Tax=Lactiplantibacillus daowaiensis TaxID=2559918 RepID=A0ABW1S3Y9_9LACO